MDISLRLLLSMSLGGRFNRILILNRKDKLMRQTKIFLVLLCGLLFFTQPGWTSNCDALPPFGNLFGVGKETKAASLETLLHRTVHSARDAAFKTKDNEHAVFHESYETNFHLVGSTYILNFKFVYDPTRKASQWASYLGPIERERGVFNFFQNLLEKKFLDDLMKGVPQKAAPEHPKKRWKSAFCDDGIVFKKQKLADQPGDGQESQSIPVERDGNQVLADYYMYMLKSGLPEFKKIFSVALNPITVFKGKKTALGANQPSYKRGNHLEFSISSLSFPDSRSLAQFAAKHNIPLDQMTNVISDDASLGDVFWIIEKSIQEELERYCHYIEQITLGSHGFMSMYS